MITLVEGDSPEKMLPAKTTSLRLRAEAALLLDGPLSLRIVDGEASCLGAPLLRNVWLDVRGGRRVSVEAVSPAEVEMKLARNASFRELDASTIPGSWREASQIAQQARGTVLILGGVDSGKSTLSTLLANGSVANNQTVALLDGDIGQADIGPPTTISGAHINTPIYDLQRVEPEASFFVGDTNPGHIPGKAWTGLTMVKSRLSSAEVLIVNTDGWLDGPEAFAFKQGILERLRPNLVLAMDDGEGAEQNTLNRLVDSVGCAVVRLARSGYARRRSREERKKMREIGYKRFLEGAVRTELALDQVSIIRFDTQQSFLEPPRNDMPQGVLSGLLGKDGMLLGVCRVLGLNGKRATVETRNREVSDVRTLELGSVVLSSDYEEVGFYSYM